MITIQNDILSVIISQQGGALQSIRSIHTNIEYLWQGDRTYWSNRAPNLFPFVGRLFKNMYTVNGKAYPMNIHGFLSKSQLDVEKCDTDSCVLVLKDNAETYKIYPYHFTLYLCYSLNGSEIEISFKVKNQSETTMYCGFGGHPGFNVPLEEGLRFEDYRLTFSEHCFPELVEFSPSVLDSSSRSLYPLREDQYIPLRHDLFTFDAVVLDGTPHNVEISSPKGCHGVQVRYPQMRYVGLWHKPNTDAPFVCIEPWSVLPGRESVLEELTSFPNMTVIPPSADVVNQWSIKVW